MAKKRGMIELPTYLESVGELKPIKPGGPVAPVKRGEQTRYLQDGRWLPSWLVWLRRKRLALALVVVGGAMVLARLLLGGRDGS